MRASPPPGCQKGYPLCLKVDIPFVRKWISPLPRSGYPPCRKGDIPLDYEEGGLVIVTGGVVDNLGYDLCFAMTSETSSRCWQTTSNAC